MKGRTSGVDCWHTDKTTATRTMFIIIQVLILNVSSEATMLSLSQQPIFLWKR